MVSPRKGNVAVIVLVWRHPPRFEPLRNLTEARCHGADVEARGPAALDLPGRASYGDSVERLLEVVAGVIWDGDQLLACRRKPSKSAGGKWEFPGGKIEAGESVVEALRREIAEELETEILALDILTRDDTVVGGQIIRLICVNARLIGERPQRSSDHDELRWLHPSELERLDWAEPDRHAVALLATTRP